MTSWICVEPSIGVASALEVSRRWRRDDGCRYWLCRACLHKPGCWFPGCL